MDRNNEPISALIDGELEPKAADFLIRRLSDDEKMHRYWQRGHLIRSCLQHEFNGPVALVERVQAALEGEAVPRRDGRWPTLMRMGIGGAVAASVAMVAVLGLADRIDSGNPAPQQASGPGFTSQSTALDRQFSAPAVPAGFGAVNPSANVVGAESATQQRINRYMIRHSQAAGSHGFISLTPVLAAPASVPSSVPEESDELPARNVNGR
ncbi:MAG TPA: sigma-E factor negative regulatory protein [Wenzhouxiangellaceae bacterium]|nr:sigma-E factor negative regulatory protein [Wenzhouxiangellaceae bacterium]